MSNELLPCPFCGEAPKAEGKYVGCVTEDCLMEGLTFILSAWNTRAPIPATPGEDRVREAYAAVVDELEKTRAWLRVAEAQVEGLGGTIQTPQALSAPAPTREDGVRGFTFEDAMRIVRGAIDVYGGGYSGEERKAFTAGIQTAFNCLENARPNDTQTAANLRIGSQALASPAPVCVCGHAKADHAEKHGWECSEECACLKYTPAPAPDEVK